MKIIICLDQKNGLLFNGRRQSRDKVLCERILSISDGAELWMTQYSAKLFQIQKINICENFFIKAKKGDYCFAEGDEFLPYLKDAEQVIVYRWDKVYPSDLKLDSNALLCKKLISVTEFEGNSHKIITEEIYE